MNISNLRQPNGAESHFIYDKNNRLATVEKPDGSTLHFEYDKNGNRTKITDENGNTTYLAYDKLQRVTEVSTDEGIQFSYEYNSDGQITSVTDAMDNSTEFMYNEGGELIQEINALGDSRSYTYTALGKVQTVTDEAGRVTKYDYEPGGRLKSIIHPDSTSEIFTFDNNGNIKTHTNKLGLITTYVYDCMNRVVEITGANGGSKKYSYDQVGNVLSMTNELDHTTNYSYTLTGQLEKVIDSLGNETHYDYDKLDQLIEVHQLGEVDGTDGVDVDLAQANQLNEASRITTYKRNLLGQVTSVTDALGQSEHYTYSPVGQLIRKMDKEGFTTEFGYTSQGDVNYIKYQDGREVFMDYNPLSQLTEVRDWLGTTSIEVDPFGQATKVIDHNDNIISYAYGIMGERRSLTYPDGKVVKYHYDDALRLTQIQDGDQFTNYLYDQHSRLIEKQNSNNTSTKYSFNDLGQLQSLIHSQSGKRYTGRNFEENLDQFYYEYDRLGNKVEVNRIRKGFESDDHGRYHYQYDCLNRLTRVMQGRDTLRTYQYDCFGNRTRMIEKGNNTEYSYNSLNQLISKQDNVDSFEYIYDCRGNMSETYKNNELTHRHHFGALNRLESTFNYEKNLGGSYSYNGLGNRVSKMQGTSIEPVISTTDLEIMKLNPTKQVDNVLDLTKGFNNLLQRSENGDTTSFTFDFCVLTSQNKDKTLHYFHDELGSPIRLINDRGREQDRFSFDEFGQPIHPDSNNQIFGFTGYELDDVTGDYLSPSRAYDPKTGRFTSQDTYWNPENMIYGDTPQSITPTTLMPDPLAMTQANNLYAYTTNNPLRYIDPTGLNCEDNDEDGFLDRFWEEFLPSFDSFGGWISLISNTSEWGLLSVLALVESSIRTATPRNNIGPGIFEKWRNNALSGLSETSSSVTRLFAWAPWIMLGADVAWGVHNNLQNGVSIPRTTGDAVAQSVTGSASIGVGTVVSTTISNASFWASVGSGAKKGGFLGTFKIPGVGTLVGAVVGGIGGAITYAALNASGITDAISDRVYSGIRQVQTQINNVGDAISNVWSNRPRLFGGSR